MITPFLHLVKSGHIGSGSVLKAREQTAERLQEIYAGASSLWRNGRYAFSPPDFDERRRCDAAIRKLNDVLGKVDGTEIDRLALLRLVIIDNVPLNRISERLAGDRRRFPLLRHFLYSLDLAANNLGIC